MTNPAPEQSGLLAEDGSTSKLLWDLRIEFRVHGDRAAEFIRSAQSVLHLEPHDGLPRQGEIVTYCLREALTSLLKAAPDGNSRPNWRKVSRQVVDEKKRYELSRDTPGVDQEALLRDLLNSIDEQARFHKSGSQRERQLIALLLQRAGRPPLTASDNPVRRYQGLLDDLNTGLHRQVSLQEAKKFYSDSISLLRRLFQDPKDRFSELKILAGLTSPSSADVERARELIVTPAQVHTFLSEATSIDWLDPLTEKGLLNPTSDNDGTPLSDVVQCFGPKHPERVAEWLRGRWKALIPDDTLIWLIVRAALDLKCHGIQLILDILGAHSHAPGVIKMTELSLNKMDPSSEKMWQLADRLLSFLVSKNHATTGDSMDATHSDGETMQEIINVLISGMNAGNATQRVQLIAWKISDATSGDPRWQYTGMLHLGTVADYAGSKEFGFVKGLVGAWIQAARAAKQWIPTDRLMGTLEKVPEIPAARMRAWLLSTSDDISEQRLIAEIADAIESRRPTGDELLLVERVERDVREAEVLSPWSAALGTPPSIQKVDRALAANEVPEQWRRARQWCSILPEEIKRQWRPALVRLAAECDVLDREAYREKPDAEIGVVVGSPIDQKRLESLPPLEASARVAAWRPKPGDWQVSYHGLGQTLGAVVSNDPEKWAQSPAEVVKALHHPRYITEYFAGLTTALRKKSMSVPAGKSVEVIAWVKTGPWPFTPLGGDAPYDTGWRETVRAGIELLQAFADRNVGYEGKNDAAWTIFSEGARERDEPASFLGEGPMTAAINRPCTSALQAVLSFMKYEYRATEKIRPEALTLLDEALRLDDDNGLQHRAILAPAVGFLHYIAPEWMEKRRELLFGSEAPDDMGQRTLELALEWGPADRWVLENFGSQLREAVREGATRAMTKLVSGMLAGVPGYATTEVLSFLESVEGGISNAGSELGHLLRNNEKEEYLSTALEFWRAAIKRTADLKGFGWMAVVRDADDGQWSELTLKTLERITGAIDGAEEVAERVSALQPERTRLRIMDLVVRNADRWSGYLINEKAVDLFRRATELERTDEYRRLQTALLERGVQLDDQ